MWGKYPNICEIKAITNAQDYKYWADKPLYNARDEREDEEFDLEKNILKENFQNCSRPMW
jgi:starch phosphorylase